MTENPGNDRNEKASLRVVKLRETQAPVGILSDTIMNGLVYGKCPCIQFWDVSFFSCSKLFAATWPKTQALRTPCVPATLRPIPCSWSNLGCVLLHIRALGLCSPDARPKYPNASSELTHDLGMNLTYRRRIKHNNDKPLISHPSVSIIIHVWLITEGVTWFSDHHSWSMPRRSPAGTSAVKLKASARP